MQENHTSGLTLYELLAREWSFDAEIVQVDFNSDDTAVLFRLSSGGVALVGTEDAESTKSRTRVEVDSGRTTIRPRKQSVPKARFAPIGVKSPLPVVRFGSSGFMATNDAGVPHLITARGQSIEKLSTTDSEITALCSSSSGHLVAIARQSQLTVYDSEKMAVLHQIELNRGIERMAFAGDGRALAIWGQGCLEIVDTAFGGISSGQMCGISNVTQITWDNAGTHLACATSTNAFYVVDVSAETFHQVTGYPHPVNSAVFSENAKALLTSGAYRLAGWSTDNLPRQDQAGTPLTTGKPGFIVISAIAAHPEKSLVAVGYANGLITIANIGTTQEMMIHQEPESEVNSLNWSNTGEHLAVGFNSGKAAVVTFPDQLFK